LVYVGVSTGTIEMSKKRRNRHHGSTVDDFLEEEGVLDEMRAVAIKEVIAWQKRKGAKKLR
jgi:hypothetical protein